LRAAAPAAAVDPRDGRLLWKIEEPGIPREPSPSVGGDVLVAGAINDLGIDPDKVDPFYA